MSKCLREVVIETYSSFVKVRALLFTTFTFDPWFFENNVLPVIFSVKDKNEFSRKSKINSFLFDKPIDVFYDKNISIKTSGNYNYLIHGIGLEGRRFHPKIIIMSGEIEDSKPAVKLIVTSANLTYSGWARQEEVVSVITLESNKQTKDINNLKRFLKVLKNNSVIESTSIVGIQKCLNNFTSNNSYVRGKSLYFGGIGERSFQEVLTHGKIRHKWDALIVVAPYWADLYEQAKKFPVKNYILVPSQSNGLYTFNGSCISDFKKLKNENTIINFMDFKYSKGLFRHAKAFFLIKKNHLRIGIGSCNFTSMGLKNKKGNIEAMIIIDDDKSHFNELVSILREININEKNTLSDSNAPPFLPFDIIVYYNWEKKLFSYTFNKQGEVIDPILILPGCDEIKLSATTGPITVIPTQNRYFIDGFKVKYSDKEDYCYIYSGPIIEVHPELSEKNYVMPLNTDDIIESWKNPGAEIPPVNRKNPAEDDSENELIKEEVLNINYDDTFNYYSDFRALYDLKSKLKRAKETNDLITLKGLILTRPDSIKKFVNNISPQMSLERKFCFFHEFLRICSNYSSIAGDFISQLEKKLKSVESELVNKLKYELPDYDRSEKIEAAELVEWFKTKLEEN